MGQLDAGRGLGVDLKARGDRVEVSLLVTRSVRDGVDLVSVIGTVAGVLLAGQLQETVRGWLAEAREELEAAKRTSRLWTRVHYALGLPAAILVGAAGVTGVADAPGWVSATLAFSSAGASSAYVFLRPNVKALEAERLVGARREVVKTLEVALAVDLADEATLDAGTARQLLRRLAGVHTKADEVAS